MADLTQVSNEIFANIRSTTLLTEKSKSLYIRNLELLAKYSNVADAWTAVMKPNKTFAALQCRFDGQLYSLYSLVSAAISAFNHVPRLKAAFPKTYATWSAFLKSVQEPIRLRELSSQPTERQMLGWTPLEDIVAMRNQLPYSSPARLLLAMYTDIPSRRNDFSHLRIYKEEPPADSTGNYIILPSKGTDVWLVLQDYKTSKIYKTVKEKLPPRLIRDIRVSLQMQPRDFLFVSTRNQKPYNNEATFDAWVNGTLKRTFKKPLTLTLIRHAYVTNMSLDDMTPLEREDIARRMGHNRAMQDIYKFRFSRTEVTSSSS